MKLHSFRVQLAYKEVPWEKLRYPVLVSPKLDGIRAVVQEGVVLSRALIEIPNREVQLRFAHLEGFDGELIVGAPTGNDVYTRSESGIMSVGGIPDVSFYVFDWVSSPKLPASKRLEVAAAGVKECGQPSVHFVPQLLCHTREEVEAAERKFVDEWGFEGAIVRSPDAPYKYGRSTPNDQVLMKMKRWSDSEARIVGFNEELQNNNEAEIDARGLTKRGHSQAKLVGKGRLGSFEVFDIKTKERFSVDGFTHEEKQEYWDKQDQLLGKIIKYKYFAYGMKNKPRQPKFIGFRNEADL